MALKRNYAPNFNDPRVQKRVIAAIEFVCIHGRVYKEKHMYSRSIDSALGRPNDKLGNYLRNKLLLVANKRFNKDQHITKTYYINPYGFQELCKKVGVHTSIWRHAYEGAVKKHKKALTSQTFDYFERSHRHFHHLQFVSTGVRRQLFADYGLGYNYDISSAAPTLILQYARKHCNLTAPTKAIDYYIANKKECRDKLAEVVQCTTSQAKELINSSVGGSCFGPENSIADILGKGNYYKQALLKDNEWFIAYRKDIKKVWDKIKKHKGITCRFNGRMKMRIYFEIEEQVMLIGVMPVIRKNKAHCFFEHDGFRCNKFIDPYDLTLGVKRKLGYELEFKWESVEKQRAKEVLNFALRKK